MRAIIAFGFAAVLFGTAFAQNVGTGPTAGMLAQIDQANRIVAHVDQAYGAHFMIVQAEPPYASPNTSWQFGPRPNLYPNGQ